MFFIFNRRELSLITNDLKASTLVGEPCTRPLAVLHLKNGLYIFSFFLSKYFWWLALDWRIKKFINAKKFIKFKFNLIWEIGPSSFAFLGLGLFGLWIEERKKTKRWIKSSDQKLGTVGKNVIFHAHFFVVDVIV